MRKSVFCLCENKGADQLRSYYAADQRLCFRYIDSTTLYFLNPNFQASSHLLLLYSPVYVGPGPPENRFSYGAVHLLSIPGIFLTDTTVLILATPRPPNYRIPGSVRVRVCVGTNTVMGISPWQRDRTRLYTTTREAGHRVWSVDDKIKLFLYFTI